MRTSSRLAKLRVLAHRIGHRGAFLAFLAFLDLVYGRYLAHPPPGVTATPLYTYLASIMPLWAWATVWVSVGVICAAQVCMRRDAPAFFVAAGLKLAWGLVNVAAWLSGTVRQGYVSGAIWLAFGAVVLVVADWPEQAD